MLSLAGFLLVRDFNGSSSTTTIFPLALVFKTGQGALAQYVRVPADHFASKPSNINFIQASGISLAGITAMQGIRHSGLEAGQTILINGGTTAVGSTAIQIAKAIGCKVVATCSTPNVETVKGLGADIVRLTVSQSRFFPTIFLPRFLITRQLRLLNI